MENYINEDTIVKNEIYENFKDEIICSICSKIFIEPQMCMNCQNVYCRECIEEWSKRKNQCPNRCENPNYKRSLEKTKILSKLKFTCQKCRSKFSYEEIKKHTDECKNDKNIEENKMIKKNIIEMIKKEEIEKVRNNKDISYITCKKNKYKFIYSNHIRCCWCGKNKFNRNVRQNIFHIIILK